MLLIDTRESDTIDKALKKYKKKFEKAGILRELRERQNLEQKLWNIADTLRGKMDADDFRDYILGFIFYKYLSEKMHSYANAILKPDKITYDQVEKHKEKKALLAAIKDEALDKLGYFLAAFELFSEMARRGTSTSNSRVIYSR
jgi:type I restriction enzyme M protein